jgi:dihydropteroate synthase
VTLTPLASRDPIAVRDALVRRGMAESRAEAAAEGAKPLAFIVEIPDSDAGDALAAAARTLGVECVSGAGWSLLAGSTARLAGIARLGAGNLPDKLIDEMGAYLAGSQEVTRTWLTARGAIDLCGPVVVGILNITPDSFSDGGRFLDPTAALHRADEMIGQGAGMLDVGAESSRPGRPAPVSPAEEWDRLAPVLKELVRRHPQVPISVDTVKAGTAARALDHGAWVVNDVSGLRLDPDLAAVCADSGAGLILMHSRGDLRDMATDDHASYDDVVADPGLGFSKSPEQTLAVVRELPDLASMGYPVMIGPSRKRFIGAITGKDVSDRDDATAHVCVAAYMLGAALFRVHAVAKVREALDVAAAVRSN